MSWWLVLCGFGFGAFESVWRRWFGGGFQSRWKWLNVRFLKHCVNVAALFAVCFWLRDLKWGWALYAALVLELAFWTPTFGMYFDIGRSGKPATQYDLDEYNKSWFAPILNWLFPESIRYTPYYDYIGMFIRFTAPTLLLFFVPTFNSGILFLGSIVSMAYGVCWVLLQKGALKDLWPTELAEYASGLAAGLYWWFLGMC